MKKKILTLGLSIILAISLAGCGSKTERSSKKSNSPTEARTTSSKSKKSNTSNDIVESESSDMDSKKNSLEKSKDENSIDPFKDLKVTFMGASPFATVNIDTSKCDEWIQNHVNFEFEDNGYKIGDKVEITASIKKNNYGFYQEETTGSGEYTLSETSKEYAVEDVAEMLTSLDGIDTTALDDELIDVLLSNTTQAPGSWDFGDSYLETVITSISEPVLRASYFVTLKPSRYSSFNYLNDYSTFNYYIKIYDFNIACDGTNGFSSRTVSCCVLMKNVKKEMNGTLIWGDTDFSSKKDNYEQLFNDKITALRDEYNLIEIAKN